MKISILLPYKENFSPTYAGAVSLFVKDTVNLSKFKKTLKNTEKLSKEIVTLPIYPNLKDSEINRIFKVVKNWYKQIKL